MKMLNRIFSGRKTWRFIVERENVTAVMETALNVAESVGRSISMRSGRIDGKGDNQCELIWFVQVAITNDECRKIVSELNGKIRFCLEYIHG